MADLCLSPDTRLAGGCHCGAVRYVVEAAAHQIQHCHCSICRRTQGAVFATYAAVSRGAIVVEQRQAALATFVSSAAVRRQFCRNCGCHLLLEDDRTPDLIWYTPATLDRGRPGHPEGTEQHVFLESRLSWFHLKEPG
ncbi:MAG TPA: GFA family protein [Alphaproteobacteria bacterium]|nr:GFA family protein [Alphaproteobacteria bacterium]